MFRLNRRCALSVGFLGGVGLSLSDYLQRVQGNDTASGIKPLADAVIFIHLAGGPAHLDTLDMKPNAPADERGEFAMIDTSIAGLSACEHLPKLAAAMDRFTLLRGISHTTGDHPRANQFLFTGNEPSPAVEYPAMGSTVAKERPSQANVPTFVAIPNSDAVPGFLGVEFAPFKTTAVPKAGQAFEMRGLALGEGLTVERVGRREALRSDLDQTLRAIESDSEVLNGLDRFGRQAMNMILSPHARQAFDISLETHAIKDLFATDDFSQSCLLAARLVEQGVRFVTVTHDAWDTHIENFPNLKNKLLPPFDAGITSLVDALLQKSLLDRTLVVATGEFGRTPSINKNGGRDHWPRTMWTLMTGGGVQPGRLIGGTDDKGHGPDDATHLRPEDLAASIFRALGLDHRREYHTKTGRPVVLVSKGDVIEQLFG